MNSSDTHSVCVICLRKVEGFRHTLVDLVVCVPRPALFCVLDSHGSVRPEQ